MRGNGGDETDGEACVLAARTIADFVSCRSLAKRLGIDRQAVSALVKALNLAVVTHPSAPNAKLLGPAEVATIVRALTPAEKESA